MDPTKICDNLLSYIKQSNLNFSLSETPFSVSICLRKTFIKDRNGVTLSPIAGMPFSGHFGEVIDENQALKAAITHHEKEQDSLKDAMHELDIKLQKAKVEIEEISFNNNQLMKTKDMNDNYLGTKEAEVNEMKVLTKKL